MFVSCIIPTYENALCIKYQGTLFCIFHDSEDGAGNRYTYKFLKNTFILYSNIVFEYL